MIGSSRPKGDVRGINAAHAAAYAAQIQFTVSQLDDAYRWLCQQRKYFPTDADIWHFHFHFSDAPGPEGGVNLFPYLWNSGNRVFMFPKFICDCRLSYCSQHSTSQRVVAVFGDFANRDAVAA